MHTIIIKLIPNEKLTKVQRMISYIHFQKINVPKRFFVRFSQHPLFDLKVLCCVDVSHLISHH